MKRRLTAILAADVVGYCRLMERRAIVFSMAAMRRFSRSCVKFFSLAFTALNLLPSIATLALEQ